MGTKQSTSNNLNSNKFQESLKTSNVRHFGANTIDGFINNREGWYFFDEAYDPTGPYDTQEIAQASEYLYGKWLDSSGPLEDYTDDLEEDIKNLLDLQKENTKSNDEDPDYFAGAQCNDVPSTDEYNF